MKIAAVLPCYRVRSQVAGVLARLGPEITTAYVVDDACPEGTGDHVEATVRDPRVRVLRHAANRGVGGAVKTGYRQALADGADIVVKIDGDGQMDPALVPALVRPIVEGRADYAKGNRFFDLDDLRGMPGMRLFGNSMLSLVNKAASGYWDVMDPANGFTAIHARVLARLPLAKVADDYFFESDMLFRLGTLRAVVADMPMTSRYEGEPSSLRISRVAVRFPGRYARAFAKRIFYNYYLRDFNAGSVHFALAGVLLASGIGFGLWHWYLSVVSGVPATAGTVMVSALPILLGGHLLISAINHDVASVPRVALHPSLPPPAAASALAPGEQRVGELGETARTR